MIKIGYNPNLAEDIKKYFDLTSSLGEINELLLRLDATKPSYYDRLVAFVDKIEFVEHLNSVRNEARTSDFTFDGKEVNGIDNDIDALNIYLILSCIDMFAALRKHEPFEEWLPRCTDINDSMSFEEYISIKVTEYKKSFGVSSNFREAILKSSEAKSLSDNLKVLTCRFGKVDLLDNFMAIEIDITHETNDMEAIVDFLKNVRHKYTHEGSRVYYNHPDSPSLIIIGVRLKNEYLENRSGIALSVNPRFDLLSVLKKIAVEQCRIKLNLALKSHSLSFPS